MIALSFCILAIFLGLVVIGNLQSRKFRHWKSTTGKIVASSAKIHRNLPGDRRYDKEDTELREFPSIEYEYRVDETTYRCSKISPLPFADPTDMPTERILARHTLGSTATVYFDPADPKNAALERSHSLADYWIFAKALLALLVAQWLLAGLFLQLHIWIKLHSSTPEEAPFVTGLAGFGLFFLLLAVGATVRLILVWKWPSVAGRIKSLSVESFHFTIGDDYGTAYKPRVFYTFEVDGREFQGDRVFLSFALGGFSKQQSKKFLSRYHENDTVRVFYNPRKPSDCVLTRRIRGLSLFWIIASGFLFAAWYLAT